MPSKQASPREGEGRSVAERDSRHLGDRVNHVALFLVDGLSHREELLTMTIQDALGDVECLTASYLPGNQVDGLPGIAMVVLGRQLDHRTIIEIEVGN